jgi:hypothetical protein
MRRILSPSGGLSAALYPPSDPCVHRSERKIKCTFCNGTGKGKRETEQQVPSGTYENWRGDTVTRYIKKTVLVDGECYMCEGIGRLVETTEMYRGGGDTVSCGGCGGTGQKETRTEYKEYYPSGKAAPSRFEVSRTKCLGCGGSGKVKRDIREITYVLSEPDYTARR